MLRQVAIKDYRSCHGVVLDELGPLTVLVGRNAVGKTNILRAIDWAAQTATTTEPAYAQGSVSLVATVGKTDFEYATDLQRRVSHNPELKVTTLRNESLARLGAGSISQIVFERRGDAITISEFPRQLTIGLEAPCISTLLSVLPPDSTTVTTVRPFRAALESVRYYDCEYSGAAGDNSSSAYVQLDAGSMVRGADYENWLSQMRSTGDAGKSVIMRLLHLSATPDDRFDEIKRLLSADGLGIIEDIRVEELAPRSASGSSDRPDFYWIRFKPATGSQSGQPLRARTRYFDFRDLSSGTQRVVRTLVSLIFDKPAVMLLEHPEDGIHRGLLRKLIGTLKSYSDQTQLILSSHSSIVFNMLELDAVRLVTMSDGETRVRRLSGREVQAAGRYLDVDGTVADFLETIEEE